MATFLEAFKHILDARACAHAGDPLIALTRYLRCHPEVVLLACNENGYLGRSLRNGSQRSKSLPVPVVLVGSDAAGAWRESRAQTQDVLAVARAA